MHNLHKKPANGAGHQAPPLTDSERQPEEAVGSIEQQEQQEQAATEEVEQSEHKSEAHAQVDGLHSEQESDRRSISHSVGAGSEASHSNAVHADPSESASSRSLDNTVADVEDLRARLGNALAERK